MCAIEDEQDAHCTFVVGLGDCSKSLLACRVPDLEYHDSIIELDFLVGKVCTDRGLKVVGEPGMFELLDQRGLTHS